MRRADRLFQLIQILRRHRRPVTAAELAAELEISVRSVYRDVADLMAQRVPIRGEAGVGYVLEDGFDLPPLMLSPEEVEAAVLGAQWVSLQGDPGLARAAQDLIAKVAAVIPERMRPYVDASGFMVAPPRERETDAIDMGELRAAMREGRKVAIGYRDEGGSTTRRVIWPVTLGYFQTVRLIGAWCELRGDFRHFRSDRVAEAEFLEARYPGGRERLWAAWRKRRQEEHAEYKARLKAAGIANTPAAGCSSAAGASGDEHSEEVREQELRPRASRA